MNNQKKYNGYTNYETWATALWIDGKYNNHQYRRELVEQAKKEQSDEIERRGYLALSLKNWIEKQNPLADNNNLFVELLNSALNKINWYEIAENYLDE